MLQPQLGLMLKQTDDFTNKVSLTRIGLIPETSVTLSQIIK